MPDRFNLASGHLQEAVLNEYLDGMLEAAFARQVEEHLAMCPECRLNLESLQVLFSSLEELPDEPLERDLVPGVFAGVSHGAETVFLRRIKFALGLQIGLAVALLVSVWPWIEEEFLTRRWLPSLERTLVTAVQFLSEGQLPATRVWQELSEKAVESLQTFEQWLAQSPAISFSTIQLALLLGASLFIWLAVNRRLIGQSQSENKSV
jgi:anti-sigma factor RsiW